MQTTPGMPAELSGPELEFFALNRLQRFASRLGDQRLQEIPAWERLARHATSIAIADCLALGLGDEMLPILEEALGYLGRP
jgi:hypothetical protein